MPCIYADFTQEPSLAPVFTSCPNKAHPDLNSCHLDSAEKEKTRGLGLLMLRALAYLGSRAACSVFSGTHSRVISVIKSGGGHTLCCLSTLQLENCHPCLLLLFSPICFVLSFLVALLEIWFMSSWCKKQKASMQPARHEGMIFSTQRTIS